MKKFFGVVLIVVGVIAFFKEFNGDPAYTIGLLIGLALFVVPGILLLRDKKDTNNKKQ